jgi:alpha-glucoside transport system substrate-binding protein
MPRGRFFAALVVLSMLAVACQPSASGSPAESAGASQSSGESYLDRAEAGEFDGTTVLIEAQWIDAEGENFEANLTDFAERTGIDIQYEGLTDYESTLIRQVDGDDAPDIAQIAQPGRLREFQAAGNLINLSDFIDLDAFNEAFGSWADLVSVDGSVYGIPYQAAFKSIIWYPNAAFEEAGYEIPETWDDLMALTDTIRETGVTPWCVSMEHGDATGWVGTDWIEDVLLRTAGSDFYDQWVAHEVPFNAPEVLEAADQVAEVWFTEGNVYGGSTAINNTFVGDTQNPMFAEGGPQCWFHKQASWIYTFWPGYDAKTDPPTVVNVPGVDSSFFYVPPIDEAQGRPALGAGDMFMMFNDRDEVRAVIEFLATPEAAEQWIATGSFVSPNATVPQDWYSVYPASGLAEILATTDTYKFDASDLMPAEVGQRTFWDGMVDWVAADGANTEEVFQAIEDSWPAD